MTRRTSLALVAGITLILLLPPSGADGTPTSPNKIDPHLTLDANSPPVDIIVQLAERAAEKGIRQVVFDRGNHKYHGRVAALATAARQAGLEF